MKNQINSIYVIGDYREKFINATNSKKIYNDHPSRKSIQYILQGIRDLDYKAKYYGGVDKLIQAYENGTKFSNDILFFNVSDGLIQNNRKAQSAILLELLGVKYIGSDAMACLAAANKHFAKLILKDIFIKSPNGILVTNITNINSITLTYPLVVKPNRDGSSVGISNKNFIQTPEELYKIIEQLLPIYNELIVEEYISGYEITNFIIGNSNNYQLNEAIAIGINDNYIFRKKIIGAYEKANGLRQQTLAQNILPCSVVETLKQKSEKIFDLLGIKDFARIDYRISENQEIFFLEINTNPVISPTSEVGLICEAKNLKPKQILSMLINVALQRQQST